MGLVRVSLAALAALLVSLVLAVPAFADHDTYGVAEYSSGAGLTSMFETPLAIPGSQATAPITQAGGNADIKSPGFRRLDQDPVRVRLPRRVRDRRHLEPRET